jgi:hypothetical protein
MLKLRRIARRYLFIILVSVAALLAAFVFLGSTSPMLYQLLVNLIFLSIVVLISMTMIVYICLSAIQWLHPYRQIALPISIKYALAPLLPFLLWEPARKSAFTAEEGQ